MKTNILLNMLIRCELMCVCARTYKNTHWLTSPHVIFFSGRKRFRLWPNWVYFRCSQRTFLLRIRTAMASATTVNNDVSKERKKERRGNISNIAHKLIFKMKKFYRCTDDDAKANEDLTSWKCMRLLICPTCVSVPHTTWTRFEGRMGCSDAKWRDTKWPGDGRMEASSDIIATNNIFFSFFEPNSDSSEMVSLTKNVFIDCELPYYWLIGNSKQSNNKKGEKMKTIMAVHIWLVRHLRNKVERKGEVIVTMWKVSSFIWFDRSPMHQFACTYLFLLQNLRDFVAF